VGAARNGESASSAANAEVSTPVDKWPEKWKWVPFRRTRVTPVPRLAPISLMERGVRKSGYTEAYISGIPLHVATQELEILGKMLNWPTEHLHVRGLSEEFGPGNALTITLEHEGITEVFTGFGEKGVSASCGSAALANGACRLRRVCDDAGDAAFQVACRDH
jgi:hypothetical protein